MTTVKTGAVTREDLLAIFEGNSDEGYSHPLVKAGDGHGLEAYSQGFEQLARVSRGIDSATQGLFILPWSGQSASPAAGAGYASVSLTIARGAPAGSTLTLVAGTAFEEVATDAGEGGAEVFRTGRRYVLRESATLAPGEVTRAATAWAEKVGPGYNNPRPGTITYLVQVGQGYTNTGASIEHVPGGNWKLVAANVPDVPIAQHVGAYLTVVGPFGTARALAVGYEPPVLGATPNGGSLLLEEVITIEGITGGWLTGTFLEGERVEDVSGGNVVSVGTVRRISVTGTTFRLVIAPATSNDTFPISAGCVLHGKTSLATLTPSSASASKIELPLLAAASGTVSWTVLDTAVDLKLSSTNALSPSGGIDAQLDEIGAERAIPRARSEDDDTYRARVAQVADTISPNAICRAANRYLTPAGAAACVLREAGLATLPGMYLDVHALDLDPTARGGADRWRVLLSFDEFRGFFLVEIPRMGDGEFGFAYDKGGTPVYDAEGWLSFYDGFGLAAANRRIAIWTAIEKARAGGVGWDLVEAP